MIYQKLIFRVHAIRRMAERKIEIRDVRQVLARQEIIEEYPDDFPYQSRLVLGWSRGRPLHVVYADNHTDRETIVITVYEPDPSQWGPDFKKRKP
ncbi:MAG: DUF4258 domain-containing protein [Terriglobia bacterium]